MCANRNQPRALFLFVDGQSLPDSVVCSGELPSQKGTACIYSDRGRFPLNDEDGDGIDGQDPPCALMRLGQVGAWHQILGGFPEDMQGLPVYKCKQMLLFVLPNARRGT
jgi:hypothetical protein